MKTILFVFLLSIYNCSHALENPGQVYIDQLENLIKNKQIKSIEVHERAIVVGNYYTPYLITINKMFGAFHYYYSEDKIYNPKCRKTIQKTLSGKVKKSKSTYFSSDYQLIFTDKNNLKYYIYIQRIKPQKTYDIYLPIFNFPRIVDSEDPLSEVNQRWINGEEKNIFSISNSYGTILKIIENCEIDD